PASETGLLPTRVSGGGGTHYRDWLRATRPVRLARGENRGPATLVDAVFARPRTWVRFPPSPLPSSSHALGEDGRGGYSGLSAGERRRGVGGRQRRRVVHHDDRLVAGLEVSRLAERCVA